MRWKKKERKLLLVSAVLLFTVWTVLRLISYVEFNVNCEQYIKRAADASTVETAIGELEKAISYAEKNDLTDGVVSVFLHQPKNDIGFWYNNITEACEELKNLPEDVTSLEKTNVLMKIRETLIDESREEVLVTCPDGISIYPHNLIYFLWGTFSSIFLIYVLIVVIIAWINNWD